MKLRLKSVAMLAACAVLFVTGIWAQSLGPAAPEQVGMSRERLARIGPMMQKNISDGQMAGGVGLIARHGKLVYFETWGLADKEGNQPMRKDSIFRIYSMTKAITAVAVMTLNEEGRFILLDPISNYLPEFAEMKVAVEKIDPVTGRRTGYTVPAERPITILDLLRHTSGLTYGALMPHDEKGELIYQKLGIEGAERDGSTLAELIKKLASAPLVYQPGTTYHYSMSLDVLGRLVEVLSGQPLDQYFVEHIFKPLRMDDTAFYTTEEKVTRLTTLYAFDVKTKTISRSSDAMQQDGYRKKPKALMGGAGLASTAMDYARFIQMLLNGGQLDGARILGRKTVELMSTDHLNDLARPGASPPRGYGMGLSLAINLGPGRTSQVGSQGEYNWMGAAGTSFWIDPKEQMIGVFMIQNFRDDYRKAQQFKQLAYQAIVDSEGKSQTVP
jgi:CubicO group peptidase (beta-lactamase class C family)